MSQTGHDLLYASDRACRRAPHRRYAALAGLLALTVVTVVGARIALTVDRFGVADVAQQDPIVLSRPAAANNLVAHRTDTLASLRRAVRARRLFSAGHIGSVRTLSAERPEGGVLLASSSRVNDVAFSPRGNLLATAYDDGMVRLWDLARGLLDGPAFLAGSGPESAVNGVAFSPDGKLLATADADGTVRVWNAATGQPASPPLEADSSANGVTFSPNGKLVASGYADGTVRVWNAATGQLASPPLQADSSVNGVAFSADGKLASGYADGTVRVWSAVAGQAVGPDNGNWFVILAAVIAIALSALAATLTARGIRLANRRSG